MKYNYHTHTYRCHHASSSDEQYVISAINANYEILGFSDHVILPFVNDSNIRASYDLKDDYINSIRNLSKKYQKQIKIYVGFECEWDNHYYNYYKSLLDNKEVDYLIFGNHSCYFKNNKEYFIKARSSAYLNRYLNNSIKALRSGLFKIMAHPDIFMSDINWTKKAQKVAETICKEAKENNVALEINCGCFINENKRKIGNEIRYRYPYKGFWEIAKKYKNEIVVGIDAHNPSAFNSPSLTLVDDFIKELDLKIADKININKEENK